MIVIAKMSTNKLWKSVTLNESNLCNLLFRVDGFMNQITTNVFEHLIEDFFDLSNLRLINTGWNVAVIHYLHQNLHVACWFKIQSCCFLKPQEHNNCKLSSFDADVVIRCVQELNEIDEFDPKTDLLIVPKTISMLHKVKDQITPCIAAGALNETKILGC